MRLSPNTQDDWQRLPASLRLASHTLHNPRYLLEQFEALAQSQGWKRHTLFCSEQGDLPIYEIGQVSSNSLYLSAGIHGDEPVPPWALLHAATLHGQVLQERGAVLIPLWNPWGLEHNQRMDEHGKDLNRIFQNPSHPYLKTWFPLIEQWSFQSIVALHEDYDAQGWYLYEIGAQKNRISPSLSQVLNSILGADPREEIEQAVAIQGIIWSEQAPPELDEWPEVFPLCLQALHPEGICLTLESPSSAALETRALLHLRALDYLLNN